MKFSYSDEAPVSVLEVLGAIMLMILSGCALTLMAIGALTLLFGR